jgi:cytidylate kinase
MMRSFSFKRTFWYLISVIAIAVMVQTAIGQEAGDWSAINGAIEAKKMWMALDAITMGRDAGTVTFGRAGSLPYCEIRIKGRACRRSSLLSRKPT